MSKAIVVNGASFATNKVETITLNGGGDVPCTALELSQNTISFTALNATQTLTVTKTPANTTDELSWESSDTSVATVADGVVTCKGLGTATITATCGEQTATCTVTLASIVLSDGDFANLLHRGNSGTDLSADKDYAGSYGTESGKYLKQVMYLSPVETTYKALSGSTEGYSDKYPIMIPPNAATFEIEAPSSLTLAKLLLTYLDSTTQPTYNTSYKGSRAVTDIIEESSITGNKKEFTIPTNVSGLDSFYFTTQYSDQIDSVPSGVTVTFKPAS